MCRLAFQICKFALPSLVRFWYSPDKPVSRLKSAAIAEERRFLFQGEVSEKALDDTEENAGRDCGHRCPVSTAYL